MTSDNRLLRRIPAAVGIAAVIATGVFTASCAKKEEKAPETSTSTTTTTTTTTTAPPPPASPTENAPRIDPNQPNPFSPTVVAPPAQTALPGQEGRHQTFN